MKLSAKDLINIGIFTVLYMVVLIVVGQLSALLPLTQVVAPLYLPIFTGIVFMLFLTRVRHFGMVTIMGILVGFIMLATGQSYFTLIFGIVLAPLADWIMSRGAYKRWGAIVAGYVVFAEIALGTIAPLYFLRSSFLEKVGHVKSAAWVEQVAAWTPWWMFVVTVAMLAVGGLIGAYLGRAMLRKHFQRAGIA